jgi:hypothetical protein
MVSTFSRTERHVQDCASILLRIIACADAPAIDPAGVQGHDRPQDVGSSTRCSPARHRRASPITLPHLDTRPSPTCLLSLSNVPVNVVQFISHFIFSYKSSFSIIIVHEGQRTLCTSLTVFSLHHHAVETPIVSSFFNPLPTLLNSTLPSLLERLPVVQRV